MTINFFANWQRWEQLTFVLAGGIVLVFLMGLAKLWWMQRSLRKHILLDEEKRARQLQMRKSGLPVGRKIDIPFGVRALQKGVEVDGVWISRPGAPVAAGRAGGAPSTIFGANREARRKVKANAGTARPSPAVVEIPPVPKIDPLPSYRGSEFERHSRYDTFAKAETISTKAPAPESPTTYRPRQPSGRPANFVPKDVSHIDSQARAEAPTRRLQPGTYNPTASSSGAPSSMPSRRMPAFDLTSSSSDEASGHSRPPPRPPAGSRRTHAARPAAVQRGRASSADAPGASPHAPGGRRRNSAAAENGPEQQQQPGGRSARRNSTTALITSSRPPLAASRPIPVRTYATTTTTTSTTADRPSSSPSPSSHSLSLSHPHSRANTATRRVNGGFEVLPAGTFGVAVGGGPQPQQQRSRSSDGALESSGGRHSWGHGQGLSTGGGNKLRRRRGGERRSLSGGR
ncbi:hypothetical protein GGR56DRAFT_631350 [Xylariaceae sp. FL0804]|nr:hypothetical protein GGR56DRAFT_631350 [Xylariaceae sp. FL0804]